MIYSGRRFTSSNSRTRYLRPEEDLPGRHRRTHRLCGQQAAAVQPVQKQLRLRIFRKRSVPLFSVLKKQSGTLRLPCIRREEFVLALLKFFDRTHIVIGSADIQPVAFVRFHRD